MEGKKMRSTLCVVVFGLVGTLGLRGAHAIGCVVTALTPDVTLMVSGEQYAHEKYFQFKDCGSVRVVAGSVRVYYAGADGPESTEVQAVHFALPPLARTPQGTYVHSDRSLFTSIGEFLAGGVHARDGQVRSANDALASALPGGKIVSAGQDVIVTLPLAPNESIKSFTLVNGSKVYPVRARQSSIILPAAVLCVGCEFRWTANIAEQPYSGSFRVATQSELDLLETRLRETAKAATPAEDLQKLRVIDGLLEAGFESRARELMKLEFPEVPFTRGAGIPPVKACDGCDQN